MRSLILSGIIIFSKLKMKTLRSISMNFEKEWIKHFTKDVSKKDLDFRVRGSGNFIWHAFLDLIDKGSYLVGNEARKTFDKVNTVGTIYFFPWDENKVFENNIEEITADMLDRYDEVYLVASDWSWINIKTHEEELGPYFCSNTENHI
ncbi:DUF4275 family protein [Anaerococcus octavius]|nr:DUF4275 family protein [Anaerococcus octavius]